MDRALAAPRIFPSLDFPCPCAHVSYFNNPDCFRKTGVIALLHLHQAHRELKLYIVDALTDQRRVASAAAVVGQNVSGLRKIRLLSARCGPRLMPLICFAHKLARIS